MKEMQKNGKEKRNKIVVIVGVNNKDAWSGQHCRGLHSLAAHKSGICGYSIDLSLSHSSPLAPSLSLCRSKATRSCRDFQCLNSFFLICAKSLDGLKVFLIFLLPFVVAYRNVKKS